MTDLRRQLEEALRQLKQAIRARDEARRERDEAIRRGRRLCDYLVNTILDTHVELWGRLGRKAEVTYIRQVVRYRKTHTAEETGDRFHMTKRGVDKLMERARKKGYA
jgi:hypothetical protein